VAFFNFKDIGASGICLCAREVSRGATEVKYPMESTGERLCSGGFGICYYFFQIQARQMQIYVVLQEQLNTVAVQIIVTVPLVSQAGKSLRYLLFFHSTCHF